jgi:hypothetical protein
MPFQTTTHIVAKPVPGPGQRLVHGRLVGPTDETYPPGTGGPLPNPKNMTFTVTKITTVKDTNSGHTQTKREVYAMGTDEASDKAAIRAQATPGASIALGRPIVSDMDPTLAPATASTSTLAQAEADVTASHHISVEDQAAMDAHYSALSHVEKHQFSAAYPNYVPGPGVTVEEASVEKETAPAEKVAINQSVPKGAAKGPTTSAQIGK